MKPGKIRSQAIASFSAPYAPADRAIAAGLLQTARLEQAAEQRVDHTATRLIEAIRANDDPLGGVEDMLREFALSTKEGLALMVPAEALPSFRDGPKDQTRKFEIPVSMRTHRPGMTHPPLHRLPKMGQMAFEPDRSSR